MTPFASSSEPCIFRLVLPAGVVIDHVKEDWTGSEWTGERAEADYLLHPDERRAVAQAVPSRQHEFAVGRACARRALIALGVPIRPITVGQMRQPEWPKGVTGSITHTKGYVAAAVAHSDRFAGLGIDAEQNEGLPKGVMASTCRAGELAASGSPQLALDTLLFSAKEAIFKAWYPLTATWLEPLDVYVTLRFLSPLHKGIPIGTFSAALVDADPGAASTMGRLQGGFGATAGHIFTAAWIAFDRSSCRHVGT